MAPHGRPARRLAAIVGCLAVAVLVVSRHDVGPTVAVHPERFVPSSPTTLAGPVLTPSPTAFPASDLAEALFARMFSALVGMALSESGTDATEFTAAVTEHRALLEAYLGALDVDVDDRWLDSAFCGELGVGLPEQCAIP